MKVGFIFESARANYTEDILANGLFGVLGQLGTWPAKSHFGTRHAPEQAPEGSCWMPWTPATLVPEAIPALDLLIVGNPNSSEHLAVAEQAIGAARVAGTKVVMIDGDDHVHLDKMEVLLPEGPWFIRECRAEMLADDRVRPLPFAVNTHAAPALVEWTKKDIDVIWGGSMGYANRRVFVDALSKLNPKICSKIVTGRDLPLSDWNAALSRSKICVCLPGAGRLTYRYFECAAAGAFPLVYPHESVIPNDFPSVARGEFRSPADLISEIERLLVNDSLLCHLANEARDHVWSSHTMTSRASEFLLAALT